MIIEHDLQKEDFLPCIQRQSAWSLSAIELIYLPLYSHKKQKCMQNYCETDPSDNNVQPLQVQPHVGLH